MPAYDDVEVGTALPSQTFVLRRDSLVRYAGASGDFNPIHWNDRVAMGVGLPGVIAHGMLTMATAGRVVTDWTGDPGAVLDYTVRFSRPVVVPDDDTGVSVDVAAVVEEKQPGNTVLVGLTVTVDGSKVLMGARALVKLP